MLICVARSAALPLGAFTYMLYRLNKFQSNGIPYMQPLGKAAFPVRVDKITSSKTANQASTAVRDKDAAQTRLY